MYGPKGVGALYVRKDRQPRLRLQPQMEGGGQEKGLRSGTLNVPGHRRPRRRRAARRRRARGTERRSGSARCATGCSTGLRSRIEGVEVNGALEPRLPGNLHVSIARAEAETLILSLGGGIAISSGAACAEAGGKGSHVLRALGLADDRIYTALRFGIGRFNTAAEIDTVVDALAEAAAAAARIDRPRRRDERFYGTFREVLAGRPLQTPITQIACLRRAAVTECKVFQVTPEQSLMGCRLAKFPQGFPQILWKAKRGPR